METKSTFDNEAKIYEQTSRQVNIHYDEALLKLISYIPQNANNIFDICCGTGILTGKIVKNFPNANIVGVDFSSEMLEVAKQSLGKKVKFYNFDITDTQNMLKLNTNFDLAISSFGIHNIHTKEKKLVALKNVAKILKNGATFLTYDLLKGENEEEIKKNYNIQKEKLLKSFNQKETEEWLKLLSEEDDPETWEDNVKLLNQAGFCNVELLWKKDFLAIWRAKKCKKFKKSI